MIANVDESQREDVDDNWLRPPIFLFYLLRDSPAGIDHNQQHRQLDNYANVTRHSSLPGLLPSDELLLADEGLVTTSIPIRIFNTTLSTLLVIVGGGEGDNDTSSSSDVMYNGSDYDGASGDNNLSDNYSSPYLMPWPQRTSWIAIFTLMLFVAIVGNTLVAWIVLAHRRMKTVTNYFLVNLSLADLTMSLFNCIFNFTFMLNSHWPFGGFYCTVNNFIANVTVAASVFTLVAISFDRYIAIVHPLRPRMSKCIARIAITLIWLASCILAVPCLLYSQIISHKYSNGEIRIVCIVVWPDGLPSVSQQDFIYNIVFTVLTYLIPVSVMGVCYSRMSYILWRSQTIGELNQRQAESIQSKRKVVRMFMVIVMLFAVCWLPYHGYFVYQFIDDQVISYKYVQHIFLAFYWLAMSNAMINPLVYYYMNARFRQYFKTVLCHFLCRGRRLSTMTELAGAAVHLGHPGRRSSPDRSLPPGRSYPLSAHPGRSAHSSRTSSAASTPILRHRNNHRHQIIRFNTRRLIIFHQRITNQNLRNQQQSSAEIPLVHRDNLLATANNQHAPASAVLPAAHHRKTLSDTPNSAESQNVGNGAAVTMLCLDQDVSETSQTKNTSVMISYL
ncbi:neuromedin-K receptor-like isoform X2 [Daphnia pulicaria]|uniref:neuromedin-K receptor-like isoform X2 n=1 Tax=Daphnia pulicaria TaxID=35523 RepID=UPI001EE9E6CA|nr:neuromedin-K receptor-like isoform X2 [Daphnia pulicaria]